MEDALHDHVGSFDPVEDDMLFDHVSAEIGPQVVSRSPESRSNLETLERLVDGFLVGSRLLDTPTLDRERLDVSDVIASEPGEDKSGFRASH